MDWIIAHNEEVEKQQSQDSQPTPMEEDTESASATTDDNTSATTEVAKSIKCDQYVSTFYVLLLIIYYISKLLQMQQIIPFK